MFNRMQAVGLVSDAGMPGISDPGHILIKAAANAGLRVVPIPGACAFVAALVASGLPTDSFQFCGFLQPKSGVYSRFVGWAILQACMNSA